MKRIKAWFLAILMAISLLASLSGCAAVQETAAITMGQWLSLVAESFGLETYQEEQPLFAKVTADNNYFSVFQACAEWDIVEPSADVDEDTALTYNDVLISLVNAGEFLSETASDEEKVDYAIEHFDSSIRTYWGDRYIKLSDACVLLDTAVDQWINFTYTERLDNVVFSDEVVNSMDQEIAYTEEDEVVTVENPPEELANLKPGDVYTLPAADGEVASINRVSSVEVVDGKIVITNDESFTQDEALEYIQQIQSQSTEELDMDGGTGLYDENGEPIEFTINNDVDLLSELGMDGFDSSSLVADGTEGISLEELGFFDNVTGTMEFSVKDPSDENAKFKVQLTVKKSSIALKLSREKKKSSSTYKEVKESTSFSIGFSNVNLTKDVDYSWGKLKKATVKLNYKTTAELGATFEKEQDIGVVAPEKGAISSAETIRQFKDAIQGMDNSWRNTGKEKSKDIYICKIPVPIAGGFSVNLVIKGRVTFNGEVKITLTINNANGVEFKNNKLRYIKKTTVDVDLIADAKLEATISMGGELMFAKNIKLVDLLLVAGAGISVKVTAHLLDGEGHRLYSAEADLCAEEAEALTDMGGWVLTEEELYLYLIEQGYDLEPESLEEMDYTFAPGICIDGKVYPIGKIVMGSEDSLLGKIIKGLKLKITFEYEFLGEDDSLANLHIDIPGGFQLVFGEEAECRLENKPWPEGTDITGEETEGTESSDESEVYDYVYSSDLKLASMREFMNVGEVFYLDIEEMPTGYTLDDLEVIVDDEKIISYDDEFNKLTALKEGTTQVTVRTKDKKYSENMAITVSESEGFSSGEAGGGSGGGGGRI